MEPATYLIRPNHKYKWVESPNVAWFISNTLYENNCRFKPAIVKSCIREIVRERLSGMRYDPEGVTELTGSLAECIKDRVKGIYSKRYCSDTYWNKNTRVLKLALQHLNMSHWRCLLLTRFRVWQIQACCSSGHRRAERTRSQVSQRARAQRGSEVSS